MAQLNYTEKETNYIVAEYTSEPTRETVDRLAQELNKSVKSIIGKLSREGVYRRQVYVTKLGDQPITKAEIVENIADLLSVPSEKLSGLDKTPKLALRYLEQTLRESNISS